MKKIILVINGGSSTIKYKVFDFSNLEVIASGICERIFVDGNFVLKYNGKTIEKAITMKDHEAAVKVLLDHLKEVGIITNLNDIVGIGHRFVHCGTAYSDSTLIDDKCIKVMEEYSKLAPLHNPAELKVYEMFKKLVPNAQQVSAFDTSFHTSIPAINHTYSINQDIAKKYEIRRYGFHGTSYKYINLKMQDILNNKKPNLIVCHLGNGASMCAIKAGKSFNTSMGLTPLEGLVMGTRSGDIDPSIIIYLSRLGYSIDKVSEILEKQSGLQGLCGCIDMRDLTAKANAGDEVCKFTLEYYTQRIADYIVKYANQLENKIDAIVFTGGVGENAFIVREAVINKIKLLNVSIDDKANKTSYGDYIALNGKGSLPIYAVRTDEELMIAKDVKKFIK